MCTIIPVADISLIVTTVFVVEYSFKLIVNVFSLDTKSLRLVLLTSYTPVYGGENSIL